MTSSKGRFGALDGGALVVSSVVGAGIFTVPAYVARLAGTSWLTLAMWAMGGLMAMAGALCYAELAARYPRGGAEYVYLREAFGERIGFLSGWTSFVAGFSGAIAAAAVGFAAHLGDALPHGLVDAAWKVDMGPIGWIVPSRRLVALGLIAVCTGIGVGGVRVGKTAANALTVAITVGIAIMALAGLLQPRASLVAAGGVATVGAASALVPIFFTYSGWNAAAYVTGEYRNPSRDVPRALIGGTALVTVLYMAVNFAMLGTFPAPVLASFDAPVARAARALLGSSGAMIVAGLGLAALASSVCAMVITGPRIYMEMAADGVLPRAFASRESAPPPVAVVAQSIWSSVLVLTGTFEEIVTYTGFAIVLFSGAAVASLLILRRRHGPPVTFKVPWYPVVPLAFLAATLVIAVASFRYAPGPSLMGLALIGAGLPLRRFARSKAAGRA